MKQINSKLKVSVIIPVYNGAKFLRKAIDSALVQTYPNIEILVINDGSIDDGKTEEIALAYGSKIRYFKKENEGVSSALNLGIAQMKGEYFSWLSHDDEYEPQKIEKQVALLEKYPNEKILALCGTKFIDADGQPIHKHWPMPSYGKYTSLQALEHIFAASISGIALLIPKQAFMECGNFDTSLRFTQDADMWRRIFLNDYGLVVDETLLAKSRMHQGQATHLQRQQFITELEQITPSLCAQLCEKKYFHVLKKYWFSLLKNRSRQAASIVLEQLIQQKQMNLKTRILGIGYLGYGEVRPWIRRLYYKYFLNIKVKCEKQSEH